ncbi:MAG: ABC transporter ATP-binding protein [Caldimonas sp.]
MRFDGGAITALAGVSLAIDRGEFVAITGPSGCGKSTLLNLIGMLEVPTSGELFFESCRYSRVGDPSLFRRANFGFVFQSFHLIATLSALDNVIVPTIGCPGPARAHTRRARELLGRLGLEGRLDHLPSTLSGGERQRVAIARALINDPLVVLADEPTGSLDSASAGEVLDLLTGLRAERGLTLVIVTHDPDVSKRADRVVAMRDGRVLAAGANAP